MRYTFLFLLLIILNSCSSLFYYPDQKKHFDPSQFKINYSDIYIKTSDKVKLHGFLIESEVEKKGVILFFHGNAENISSHFIQIAWLRNFGLDVIIFDYRGFGKSKGAPSQRGTELDAHAMMDYTRNHLHSLKLKEPKLIYYGQSLGGVILASSFPTYQYNKEVDLIVLDSTFSSYQNIAFDKLKESYITFLLSPLAYLLVSDEKASKPFLNKIKTPSLVIHSKDDPVVPYKFGKEIFDLLGSENKIMWKVKTPAHGGVFFIENLEYREKFLKLLKTI